MLFNVSGQFLKLFLICKWSQIASDVYHLFFFLCFVILFLFFEAYLSDMLYNDIDTSRAWDMRTMESLCRACKYAVSNLDH